MIVAFRRISFSILVLGHSYAYSDDIQLVVDVVGVKPGAGYVVLSLFSSPENYMTRPVADRAMKVKDADKVTFVLGDLAKGRYSISVYYDENGNGELDTGLFGIPKELVGFSNNAKGLFGPPSFDDSSFDLKAPASMVIQLDKAKD